MKDENEWAGDISARLTTSRRGHWPKILRAKVAQIRNEQKEEVLQMLDRAAAVAKQQDDQNAINHLKGVMMAIEEEL